MILPNDLSVVIQGPVVKDVTVDVVASVRRHLTGAAVVLSTWEGANTSELKVDSLIISPDPGPVDDYYLGKPSNLNRQIISTKNGLRCVRTPFAIKLRSDCRLTHSGCLNLFGRFARRTRHYRVFLDRVITCDLYCRDPRTTGLLFHPSDVFHLGRIQDLLAYWETPLRQAADVRNDFRLVCRQHPLLLCNPWVASYQGLVPEQYLWTATLRRFGLPIRLLYPEHLKFSWIIASDLSFINNFVPYSAATLGIQVPFHFDKVNPSLIYTHETWLGLYSAYASRETIATKLGLLAHCLIRPYSVRSAKDLALRFRQAAVFARRAIRRLIGVPNAHN